MVLIPFSSKYLSSRHGEELIYISNNFLLLATYNQWAIILPYSKKIIKHSHIMSHYTIPISLGVLTDFMSLTYLTYHMIETRCSEKFSH